MRIFLLTLGFMTRIPIRKELKYQEGDLEKGILYFPLIGFILGGLAAAVYCVAALLLPRTAAIIFAILTNICLTGAFHLDGLCDTADGIYSARDRERMLEIMKDSRLGTNGAIAMCFDLALKFLGLYYLPNPWLGILLMPVAGKMVQGILGYRAVYPRKKGIGLFVGTISFTGTLLCYLLGAAFLVLGYQWRGGICALILPLFIYGFRCYMIGKIGGITGDVMGAGSELAEILLIWLLIGMSRI